MLGTWLTPSTVPAYLTAMIATVVAIISWLNWRVSRTKLKLDLYDRRFAVYVSALDCYRDVLETPSPEDKDFVYRVNKRIALLIRSTREAKILFDTEDRIDVQLTKLREWCQNWATIYDYEHGSKSESIVNAKEYARALRKNPVNDIACGEPILKELENKMFPYMSFGKLK